MTIGDRIKLKREELGITQEELAKRMGYQTRNAIYQYEKATNMKLSLVEKFAKSLNTTPSFLMGWEDEESPLEKAALQNGSEIARAILDSKYSKHTSNILPQDTMNKLKSLSKDEIDIIIGLIDKLSAKKE